MKRFHQFLALSAFSLLLTLPARSSLQDAQDDFAVTRPGQSVVIDVMGNDGALGADLRLLKAFKPAHGSASIENGRIRYTPAAGFQGSDSFKYMVQPAKSQPGQATVNVEVGQGGVSLRLAGRVVDDPIPNATVKVSVGGFDFVTQADANGNYVLDIAALRGDAFVTVTATGTSPTGAPVRFTSLVGEIVRLAGAAGGDGVLTRDENNQVNVTNLSTAQFVLLTDANGGNPVDSDQELIPLTQSVDIVELLQLAAVIKLVVDEGVPLPAGVSDPLALISDPAALDAFKASLAPDQLDLAIDAVSQDPNLVPGYRAGALPNNYALVFASAPGTIRSNITPIGLLSLTGATSGDAVLVDADPNNDDRWTWSLQGGDIVLDKVVPETVTYFDVLPSCTALGMNVTETVTQARFHMLQDGAGVDYVEASFLANRHYEDFDPGDGCPTPTDGTNLAIFQVLGFEDHTGELPFLPNESFGKFALATYAPSMGLFFGAAVFDFDTHTVNHPDMLPAFTAIVSDGRLEMDVTDSHGAGVAHQQYRRLQNDGAKGEGLFLLVTYPDGRKRVAHTLGSRIDGSATFDSANMAGLWRSGFDISRFDGDGTFGPGFYAVNNANFTGNQRTVGNDGSVVNSFPWTWAVENGTFIARTYTAVGFGRQASCAPFPNTTCFLSRVRSWQPIAREGNRIYVLEELADRANVNAVLKTGSQRLNFYELQ
jgi:hypothetical protein